MSIGEWLDSIISESAQAYEGAGRVPGHNHPDSDERSPGHGSAQREDAPEQAFAPGNPADARSGPVLQPASALDQALVEIADRQRALDGSATLTGAASARTAVAPDALPRPCTQELSALEQQLRRINAQVENLKPCGVDRAIELLRDDVAQIGVMLQEEIPAKSVQALEEVLRNHAGRTEHGRNAGAEGMALDGIERGLDEVRDALRDLAVADHRAGLDRDLQQLSQKIDELGHSSLDPAVLRQLESGIVGLRATVSHAPSDPALASLSEEVRALGQKIDRATAESRNDGILDAIEERIATLADALAARNGRGSGLPHELETLLKALVDKIERTQLTTGDQAAVGHLEDRIANLVQKLDASDARLNHLEAIERGLAELLIHLERHRMADPTRTQSLSSEADELALTLAELRQSAVKTQHEMETVRGTLGNVVDRLAMIETGMRVREPQSPESSAFMPLASGAAGPVRPTASPGSAPIPMRASRTQSVENTARPVGEQKPERPITAPPGPSPTGLRGSQSAFSLPQPGELRSADLSTGDWAIPREPAVIDPAFPPDHPLEPGVGASRRGQPASPAERIAASGSVLIGSATPAVPERGNASDFIAAARRAAQAAARGQTGSSGASGTREIASAAGKLARRVGKLRALIVGTSAIVVIFGGLQIGTMLLGPADNVQTLAQEPERQALPTTDRISDARQSPTTGADAPPESDITGALSPSPGSATPKANAHSGAQAGTFAAAGSNPAPFAATAGWPDGKSAALPPASDGLPPAFGSRLRTAAMNGDAAAEFEIASRYAEGRGVAQNLPAAAEWYERAAKRGLVPAQFRLGGLYEKGLGVKKNLDTARTYYLAAGEAGNAKALHNLAVLYAEGFDGKPDYQSAAKWFRKAADYGIADSQYNLAVLYTRGIGVERNFAEAYKWFALAARYGDTDAAGKRDDIAPRLDGSTRDKAAETVQLWTARKQPAGAVEVNLPAGGWDEAPSQPAAQAGKNP
jgi:localization factor PodJL